MVESVAVRLSNVMDVATADDVPPVVTLDWACSSPSYLAEKEPDVHHQNARTERGLLEASGILVRASPADSTQVNTSARRAYYVPTPS